MDSNLTSTPPSVEANGAKKLNTKYPEKELTYILSFAKNIYEHLGHNDYHTNKQIADANGLSDNSIRQTLSTAQQYQILELKHGTGYKLTPLYFRIIQPTSDSDKLHAILDSLESPELYKELLKHYDGYALPQHLHLKNKLMKDYGLLDYVAANVAQIFIDNLKEYNLVSTANIITFNKLKSGNMNTNVNSNASQHQDKPIPTTNTDHKQNDNKEIKIPILLKGKEMAYFSFPDDYTDTDLAKALRVLKAYIEAYKEDMINPED